MKAVTAASSSDASFTSTNGGLVLRRVLLIFVFLLGRATDSVVAFQGVLLFSPLSKHYRKASKGIFVMKDETDEITTPSSAVENKDTAAVDGLEKEMNYIEKPYYAEGTKPGGAPTLALENFIRQSGTIIEQAFGVARDKFEGDQTLAQKRARSCLPDCLGLELSNEAVKEAERLREAKGNRVDANVVSRGMYDFGCLLLDSLFDERPIARFWFLEVVARIPYFSYVSMLHFYESMGWWRSSELRKIHHAEEWNELHHLLIMESLGGNARWSDRFMGYHAAIFYYWLLNAVFLFSPRVAYEFMELLEAHAVDTYGTFVQQNRERLRQLPAPVVAIGYYVSSDLYMFDDFQVSRPPGSRRPPCDNLLDVFENIKADEAEHVKTMEACQKYASEGTLIVSPHTAAFGKAAATEESNTKTEYERRVEEQKRKQWLDWAEEFANQPDLDARSNDTGDFD